jgi:uncharacterized membrane protein
MKMSLAITVSYLVFVCAAEAQVAYSYRTFENPGATVTLVFGLNDHGDLVGADNTIAGRHAFLVNKHEYVSLDGSGILETHTSFARGVNDFGDVVGAYLDDDGNEQGFLLKKDTLTTIDVPYPGSVGTQLNAISNTGIIIGAWVDSAFTVHGFVYERGNFAHLDYPGALDTYPFGINSRGDVVGNWDTDQSTVGHGFLFSKGQIVSLDDPDAVPEGTAANGINDRGQIVGSYIGQDGNSHGFLAEGITFATLDCPGAFRTTPWGINSAGQIAGICDVPGQRRGFVADPVPKKKP